MPCDYNSPAAIKAVGERKSFLDVDVCCLSYIGLDRAATRPLFDLLSRQRTQAAKKPLTTDRKMGL